MIDSTEVNREMTFGVFFFSAVKMNSHGRKPVPIHHHQRLFILPVSGPTAPTSSASAGPRGPANRVLASGLGTCRYSKHGSFENQAGRPRADGIMHGARSRHAVADGPGVVHLQRRPPPTASRRQTPAKRA
jgi:hypothetical protein